MRFLAAGAAVLLPLVSAGAAAPANGQKSIQDRAAALRAAHGKPASEAMERLARYRADGDTPGLVAMADALLSDPALAGAARDRLLTHAAADLATMPDTPASRAFLRRLSNTASQVWIPVDEAGGLTQVVLYDVAGQARHALRELDVRAAQAAQAARIRAGDVSLVEELIAEPPDAALRAAVTRSISSAPTAARWTLAEASAARIPADPTLAELTLAAMPTADPALLATVALEGSGGAALAALRATAELPAAEAAGVLTAAAGRPELASAAVLEAGRRSPESTVLRGWLEARIGDPATGASAATALARLGDPALSTRLAERLAGAGNTREARHLVLYFRLARDAGAARAIPVLQSDPRIPAAVRGELR